jgi:hypothetical protein
VKTCKKCQQEKNELDFHRRILKSGNVIQQPYCKICSSSARKKYYITNSQKEKSYDRLRKKELLAFIQNIKKNPCVDCGNLFPPYCMDFDHISDKKFSIADGINKHGFSKEKLLIEIKKCEIVCACCHRIRTHNRQNVN